MSEEEKKDLSDPRINYRDDWAEKHGERNEAANEKSNQAQGKKVERVRDAEGGKIKSIEKHLEEGKERAEKTFEDRVGKKEPIQSKKKPTKIHLKSTSALTDPETAKQNLKDASKAKNFGKETLPSRGGGFRGGGTPMMDEPDEMLKEKHKSPKPEDILSKKGKDGSFLLAMNEEKNPVIVNRKQEQKALQTQGKHLPTTSNKEAQKQEEQKQAVKAKSFKPTPPKNILDTLPKHLLNPKERGTKAQKEVLETPQQMKASERVKKAVVEKNAKSLPTVIKKPETISPSPTKAERRSKPAGTGRIKR